MQYFDQVIFWLSSGLLVPVMVAVAYFLVQALLQIGQCYGLYVQRMRQSKQVVPLLGQLQVDNLAALKKALATQQGPWCAALENLIEHQHRVAHRNKLLTDFEIYMEKELDRSRTLSKMGPILGLMGTLIPMGPALAGLAAGDVAQMSHHMQVAFNTTVVGLVIGCVGFLILQLKQRWYAEDLNQLEFVNDLIEETREQINE